MNIKRDYSYDVIYLSTDPGSSGYRTADWDAAKDFAIRRARATQCRQVIQVFPSSEQPSKNIHRVFEVDVEHVVSNMLESRAATAFIDPVHNGL